MFLPLVMFLDVHQLVEVRGEGATQIGAGSSAPGRLCNSVNPVASWQ